MPAKKKRPVPTRAQQAKLRGALKGTVVLLTRQLHRLEREINRAEKLVKR